MTDMTEERAREILATICNPEQNDVVHDERLYCGSPWVSWARRHRFDGRDTSAEVELDGRFTPDQLEAIAWWMRNKR